MTPIDFPIERINNFLKNHLFDINTREATGAALDGSRGLSVKLQLTGIKRLILVGEWTNYIEYTLFFIRADSEFVQYWVKILLDGKNEYHISTSDTRFYPLTSKINELLSGFLKYFNISQPVICTKIVNDITN